MYHESFNSKQQQQQKNKRKFGIYLMDLVKLKLFTVYYDYTIFSFSVSSISEIEK